MLQSIMRPKAFPQDSGGFDVAMNEWEHLVQRREVLANDILKMPSSVRSSSTWLPPASESS